jgi:fatty-acyl-CoA synthase
MRGLMQQFPLTLPHLFERAERLLSDKSVLTITGTGDRERVTYGEWAEQTRRLGGLLDALGVTDAGRVATFGWNTARHLELYFAAPAPVGCSTPSTSVSPRHSSSTSSTTPPTRSSSSTAR